MDKQKRRPGTRRLVQLYAALLYNANLKGFITGRIYSGEGKAVCVPGFNCYSCPGAIASCPLGSLQNALNASGHTAPWYMLGILALLRGKRGIRTYAAILAACYVAAVLAGSLIQLLE